MLPAGSIVVLDNLGTHKISHAAAALERIGCSFAFLPAYSPDLNPMENIFEAVKSIVRKLRPRTGDQIIGAARDALLAINPKAAATASNTAAMSRNKRLSARPWPVALRARRFAVESATCRKY